MEKHAKSGGIATITLNRPEKYNTLRPSLLADLDDALRRANTDNEVKVIILEGAGDAFCAGFDFSGGLEHFDKKRGLTAGQVVLRADSGEDTIDRLEFRALGGNPGTDLC